MTRTIKGVALASGTSLNRRTYRADVIKDMVTSAQPDIAAGRLLMRAGHDSPDVSGIVGRVTSLTYDPTSESALFTAELADTSAGRDAQALAAGPRPFVACSIVGEWVGPVSRTLSREGQTIEEGSGLRLHGLDLTGRPGCLQATITAEAYRRPGVFVESVQQAELVDEAAALDLRTATSAQLRQYAAAGYLEHSPDPQLRDDATMRDVLGHVVRSGHAATLNRQRGNGR